MRKRKWEVAIDPGGPNRDYAAKIYYEKTSGGKVVVKREVRIPPKPKK